MTEPNKAVLNFPETRRPGSTVLCEETRVRTERRIVEAVRDGARCTKQIMAATRMSHSRVWRHLLSLVLRGELTKTGKCPATYTLPAEIAPPVSIVATKRFRGGVQKRAPKAPRAKRASREMTEEELEKREEVRRAQAAAEALSRPAFRHPQDIALFGEPRRAA